MIASTNSVGLPIKVGVITDQTGALSFVGIANANVAKMVINDINAKGGLLGRQIELYLEDSATTDSVAEAKAAKVADGPGGPAEMVPGQHHVRMNMYIVRANKGNFKIIKSLGIIDPQECMQGIK